MSAAERAELVALGELEDVVARISDELTTFRLRAQKAEAAQAELSSDGDVVTARARVAELERENRDLRDRIEEAKGRVEELMARLRFLEEQMAVEELS